MARGEGQGRGAGAGCMRVILVLVNLVFGVIGLALLGGGVFLKVGQSVYMPLLDAATASFSQFTSQTGMADANQADGDLKVDIGILIDGLSIGLIVIGLVLLIMAILGCIGACCQVKVVLIIYCVVLIVMFLVQLILVIVFATGALDDTLKTQMSGLLDEYVSIDTFNVQSILLNVFMIQFKCCGVSGHTDFADAPNWRRKTSFNVDLPDGSQQKVDIDLMTPIACCKFEGELPSVSIVDEQCAIAATPANNNMEKGCFGELMAQVDAYETILIGVFAGLLVFQAILIVFVICLIVIQNKKDNQVA